MNFIQYKNVCCDQRKLSQSGSECILAWLSRRTCVNLLRKAAPGTTRECWNQEKQTNLNLALHTTSSILWPHRDIPVYQAGTCKKVLPKCAVNKPEPGSAHNHWHIMTSLWYTGISRRGMQTCNSFVSMSSNLNTRICFFWIVCIYRKKIGPTSCKAMYCSHYCSDSLEPESPYYDWSWIIELTCQIPLASPFGCFDAFGH